MSHNSVLRSLLVCMIVMAFATYCRAESTTAQPDADGSGTGATETTEGSGGDDSTTQGPCDCPTGSTCSEDCKCDEADDIKDQNSKCAVPCAEGYDWGCNIGGTKCQNENGTITCVCGSNYYNTSEGCEEVLEFGGTMKFIDNYTGDNPETRDRVQTTLDEIFNTNGSGYLGSEVTDLRNGSIIADFKLFYDLYSGSSEDTVEASFNSFTKNCTGTSYEATSLTINCDSKDTLNNPSVVCNGNKLQCDNDTSMCGSSKGVTTCVCENERYEKPSQDAKSCWEITCDSNDDCNPPFGECIMVADDRLDYYCRCTVFGWSGTSCTNPWEFVFTIVTAGLGLILICVLTACIVTSKKRKGVQKTQKHEDMDLQNPFVDFQPGLVRAKVPTNAYSLSDSYEPGNGAQSHTNGAFNANEDSQMHTSTFSGEQRRSGKHDYEYF